MLSFFLGKGGGCIATQAVYLPVILIQNLQHRLGEENFST